MASEYGWTKHYICEQIYPDDLYWLKPTVRLRQIEKTLNQLDISGYPHMERESAEEMRNNLIAELNTLTGQFGSGEPLDKSGLQRLKQAMADNAKLRRSK